MAPQMLMTLRPDAFFALAVWQFARDFPSVTRFGAVDACARGACAPRPSSAAVLFAAGVLPLLLSPGSRCRRAGAVGARRALAESVFAILVFGAAFAALAVIAWRSRLAPRAASAPGSGSSSIAVVASFGPVVTIVVATLLVPPLLRLAADAAGFLLDGAGRLPAHVSRCRSRPRTPSRRATF